MSSKKLLMLVLSLLIILSLVNIGYGAEIIEVTSVRTIPNPATVKYPPGDSVHNNVWTRLYESKLGIRLRYLWAVDSSQWEQRVNIMIASGDLPDFFLANKHQFYQLLDAGLLEDLTDVYKKYASPQTKKVLLEHGPEPLASATVNGRLMAIPFTALAKEAAPILFIRSDWMKKLGLSAPKTMKDVLNIAKAFTNKDPDGNGKKDTFGLTVDKDLYYRLAGFFNSYHAYPNIWLKDKTGKLVYGSIQPEVRTALKTLQDMYKDGQIDPEFGTKDSTKIAESIAAGKIGIIYGPFWTPLWPLQDLRNRDPKAEWTPYPICTIDGRLPKLQYSLPVNGYWVVRKGCKHPEALLKIMNLWVDIFYFNKSDEVWEKYGNAPDGNEIWQNAHAQIHRAWKNLEQAQKVQGVLKGKIDISELTGDDKGVLYRVKRFVQEGDNSVWCWNKIYNEGGCFDVVEYYKKRNCYIMDQFYGALTNNMIEKSPILSKLQNETFTKIIRGAPIEEFDKFVEEWKRLGGDVITKEVNDWYTSKK